MKRNILNLNFLSAVNEKIPNKTDLANYLVDILHIEKEAVYRRLRAEVPFTFAEVAGIGQKLGISLDSLIGIYSEQNQPFSLYLHDFEMPSESDLVMIDNYVNVLEVIRRDPNASLNEVWNTLPFPLTYAYESLTRFFILKWKFQFKEFNPSYKFSNLVIPPRIKELQKKHLREYKNIKHSSYILEHSIFHKVLEDIQFFAKLGILSESEVINLRCELLEMVECLEKICQTGTYEDTGNYISIYISEIDLDTNYSCLETRNYNICMFRTLVLNAFSTPDNTTFTYVSNWISSLKKLSTLISIDGEQYRTDYLNKQKDLIKTL